ncbi:MAG TPA: twin-arginine translocase TatA/TatE family subunit [Anaerolineae bacterium]|nr:twin-arginine translocase TatA/TatE family subunit [Anaerolineae bacterium]
MAHFGWPEILIIMVIVILIFGVGKVADVGPALGKAIRGFRDAVKDDDKKPAEETEPTDKEI